MEAHHVSGRRSFRPSGLLLVGALPTALLPRLAPVTTLISGVNKLMSRICFRWSLNRHRRSLRPISRFRHARVNDRGVSGTSRCFGNICPLPPRRRGKEAGGCLQFDKSGRGRRLPAHEDHGERLLQSCCQEKQVKAQQLLTQGPDKVTRGKCH